MADVEGRIWTRFACGLLTVALLGTAACSDRDAANSDRSIETFTIGVPDSQVMNPGIYASLSEDRAQVHIDFINGTYCGIEPSEMSIDGPTMHLKYSFETPQPANLACDASGSWERNSFRLSRPLDHGEALSVVMDSPDLSAPTTIAVSP
ncbi:hypothetical protein [Nakamurella leprariae]|uniref:Uncharacterized protein n=1 Tax=Nakamurella leprariae TaxID=2803911 RepID=A0A938YFW5_9ACTN|nr:hypothetical protein [Nakamurella leprariae]MBM9468786.1 hypothetical protein [Nakamurella leprariae]